MKRSLIGAIVLCCVTGFGTAKAQEKVSPADSAPYEKAPEAIKQVQPKYPEAAKKDKIEGTVWLKVWVDESGKVAQVNVQKSDGKMFNQPAIAAAKEWTFNPAVMKGKPAAVWVTIPFRFRLQENDKSQSSPVSGMKNTKQKPPADDIKVDKDPKAIEQVNPKYPEKAFQDRIEGTVWTKMWIDKSGNVVDVKVAKTENDAFKEAAIDAGKQWKFKPALVNGNPVAIWITVPFRFQIAGK